MSAPEMPSVPDLFLAAANLRRMAVRLRDTAHGHPSGIDAIVADTDALERVALWLVDVGTKRRLEQLAAAGRDA